MESRGGLKVVGNSEGGFSPAVISRSVFTLTMC